MQDSSSKCQIEILAAHTDHIKQISLPFENTLVSASADRLLKVWDLRNTSQSISQFKVENSVEDFCHIDGRMVIAHGNALTMALYDGV
jgi:WD40 repeat protein